METGLLMMIAHSDLFFITFDFVPAPISSDMYVLVHSFFIIYMHVLFYAIMSLRSFDVTHDGIIEQYKGEYKLFCETIIRQWLIADQEVLKMSKLTQLLSKLIVKEDNMDLSYIR